MIFCVQLMSLVTFSFHRSRLVRDGTIGFSLVEVTMAIGIISFGLLSVMGLIPVGLDTLRKAMDQTVEAQIVQKLNGKILLTPFGQLDTDYSGKSFFYDQEGVEVSGSANAIFSAMTSLTQAVYPGVSVDVASSLRQVQIDITRLPEGHVTNRFNVYVPNSGN